MNNYRFNSIVSNSEQEALKEMIFKRAKERAQAITDDIQTEYASNIQNNVMELARDSFVASKNPFSQLVETPDKTNEVTEKDEEENKEIEIGFAKRQVNDLKTQISNNNKVQSADIASKEVQDAMMSARTELYKKPSFMGALNFLNSQATIALVKNKGQTFEAMA